MPIRWQLSLGFVKELHCHKNGSKFNQHLDLEYIGNNYKNLQCLNSVDSVYSKYDTPFPWINSITTRSLNIERYREQFFIGILLKINNSSKCDITMQASLYDIHQDSKLLTFWFSYPHPVEQLYSGALGVGSTTCNLLPRETICNYWNLEGFLY